MLTTNSEYLRPEIMDILRAFDCEEQDFTHYFEYAGGKFFNSIEYMGEFYDFEDEGGAEDELIFKRLAKRYCKLAFYKVLSKFKGSLVWGALTGIRPTKLAYMEKADGRDFRDLFKKTDVNEAKTELVGRILSVQKKVYESGGGQDLFVSVPFCPTKCEYCSFITAPVEATVGYLDKYIDCLVREIEAVKPYLCDLKSVYVGGGTPFVLSETHLKRIFEALNGLNPREYTVEAGRPDVFTAAKLQLCKDYGVTRICVNPQSFSDATLEKIGRKHTAKQTIEAFNLARTYGFDINLDLIAGLADETVADFEKSLKQAIELNPANITVHTLSLKSGAKLKERVKRLNIAGISDMVDLSDKLLTEAGYLPYYLYRQKYQAGGLENVGWCKEGNECIYNIDVMEEISDNIAVGANAISKKLFEGDRIERYATPKDLPTYISKIDKIIEERKKLFK